MNQLRVQQTTVASNALEALSTLRQNPFDLVFMDVQMPEVDGLDATVSLRNAERQTSQHVSVVALTAHAMKGDKERCRTAGDYISKPVHPQELDVLLQKYVALHRRQEASKAETKS